MRDIRTPQIVFVPARAIHVRIMHAILPFLAGTDYEVLFCTMSRFEAAQTAKRVMLELDIDHHEFEPLLAAARPGDVWVFDLGKGHRPQAAIKELASRGITTVGIQEGCRPTLHDRYQCFDHVLVWGPRAQARFGQKAKIVGSPRLEMLRDQMRKHSPAAERNLAVINNKFRGPLEEGPTADQWLKSVLHALEGSGLQPVVSNHIWTTSNIGHRAVSDEPIEQLILKSKLLITRPSSLVYEALVLQSQPILFPLEDDPLCEFCEPFGAFPICWTGQSLSDQIRQRPWSSKPVCSKFMSTNVDFSSAGSSGERMAKVITSLVGRQSQAR